MKTMKKIYDFCPQFFLWNQ